jgi:hypothetical protein
MTGEGTEIATALSLLAMTAKYITRVQVTITKNVKSKCRGEALASPDATLKGRTYRGVVHVAVSFSTISGKIYANFHTTNGRP